MELRRVAIALALVVGAVGAATFASAGPAAACSCLGFNDGEAFRNADVVFTAALVDTERPVPNDPTPDEAARFTFRVETVFKGEASALQVVATPSNSGMCGTAFDGGGPFLVFTTHRSYGLVPEATTGELYTNLCAGSRPVAASPVPVAFGRGAMPRAERSPAPDHRGTSPLVLPLIAGAVVASLLAGWILTSVARRQPGDR